MRVLIHRMLVNLTRTCKKVPSQGKYPPRVNLCPNQSETELANELQKMICYLEHPEWSYLVNKPRLVK
jgi:hypothetical protein